MQLKSNETPNGNMNTNGAQNPYGTSQPHNSYYDTPNDMNGQGGNQYYGGQQGGNQYNGGQQGGNTTVYGTPRTPAGNPTSAYGTPQQAYGAGAPVMKKKGINPLFIILPIVALVVIIFATQFSKIFGSTKYTPGVVEGNTLTNEHFGFKASFEADGWTVEDSGMSAEEEKKRLNGKQTVSELYAQNKLSVELLDFSVYQMPLNVDNNDSRIKDVMEDCKDLYVDQLESQGFTVESVEQDTMTIAGKTCNGYYIKCNMNGVSVGLVQFFIFEGRYLGYFSAGSTSSAKAKLIITNHVTKLD